ncbi:glutamine synthetase [Candidatus Xenohaliotis californiensis]|uniref:Glutamine synthetase n=1 Tax=Candidatus Xenohaliotis californiensis TaxID=84677 RepID=A0ABM9N970_9RICK|nr:glutamine synthetase [Candidatus Xenohaliotis californiensis]
MSFPLKNIQHILMLYKNIKLIPMIGIELEFYLPNKKMKISDNSYANFNIYEIVSEAAFGQFEAKFQHTTNIVSLIKNVQLFKKYFMKVHSANFSAKPLVDKPGSSQHVNISFLKNNINILVKNNKLLCNAIGGLCELIPNSMIYFAPTQSSYMRYIHKCYHTPTTVSWGINNRTTAIRIVKTFNNNMDYRIENRLPGSDASTLSIISAILLAIYHGIEKNLISKKPIYGLGDDPIYNLPTIPMNLTEAKKYSPTLSLLKQYCKTVKD